MFFESLQFTVYSLQFTVYGLQFTVYSLQFTVYSLQFRKQILRDRLISAREENADAPEGAFADDYDYLRYLRNHNHDNKHAYRRAGLRSLIRV